MTATTNDVLADIPASSSLTTRFAARIAFAGAAVGLLALGIAHLVNADLDPSWHVISEYALGAQGWVITTFFYALAASCAGLLVALVPRIRTIGGRIGLGFLGLAAIGLAMGGLFPMDPLTTPPHQATTSAVLHNIASAVGNDCFVIAATLLTFALRRNHTWAALRSPLRIAIYVLWIGLILMTGAVIMVISTQPAMEGIGLIGLANRLLVVSYCIWLMLATWPLIRRS